jgi:hypothetical protein
MRASKARGERPLQMVLLCSGRCEVRKQEEAATVFCELPPPIKIEVVTSPTRNQASLSPLRSTHSPVQTVGSKRSRREESAHSAAFSSPVAPPIALKRPKSKAVEVAAEETVGEVARPLTPVLNGAGTPIGQQSEEEFSFRLMRALLAQPPPPVFYYEKVRSHPLISSPQLLPASSCRPPSVGTLTIRLQRPLLPPSRQRVDGRVAVGRAHRPLGDAPRGRSGRLPVGICEARSEGRDRSPADRKQSPNDVRRADP